MNDAQPTPLFTAEAIERRIDELAARISADHAGAGELTVVGILKGAFILLADLTRRLTIPHRVDFVSLASYGDAATSSGEVRLLLDLRKSIRGRHVLIVDDIIDTGSTLAYLVDLFQARGIASLKTCTLVRKAKTRRADVDVDYVGFDIDDVWVVGYGLDYADRYRTLPYIGVIEP